MCCVCLLKREGSIYSFPDLESIGTSVQKIAEYVRTCGLLRDTRTASDESCATRERDLTQHADPVIVAAKRK